jgi:hypothetical protein
MGMLDILNVTPVVMLCTNYKALAVALGWSPVLVGTQSSFPVVRQTDKLANGLWLWGAE